MKKIGRPSVKPEAKLKALSIYLSDADRAKIQALGGSKWVRAQLKKAKPGK